MCSRGHLCQTETDRHSHLPLHCVVAHRLFQLFLSMTGLKWTMAKTTKKLLIAGILLSIRDGGE